MLNASTVQSFHLHQQFLIVLTQDVQNASETLDEIFAIVLNVGLLDVNVLIENKELMLWSLYYYIPYTQDCHSFLAHELTTFSSLNYTNELNVTFNDLYPPKSFKFHNCPLYISTFPLQPIVIIEHKIINGTTETTFDGVDIIIVNQISKTLNLIPKYMQSPDHINRGFIYENGTATGALGMVKFSFKIGQDFSNFCFSFVFCNSA